MTDVLRRLFLHPGTYLIQRWHWKAATLASILRGLIFFASTWKAGWRAALSAMLVEFVYRAVTSGFWGAITQAFEEAAPAWQGALCALIVVPVVSHGLEIAVHLLKRTPHLGSGMTSSVIFTVLSTLFNFYAMEHGALRTGADASTLASDLRRMPLLIAGFVLATPIAIASATARALNVIARQFTPISQEWPIHSALAVLSSRLRPRVRTEQIPAVALQIKKDRDLAVWFDARPRDETDPGICHSFIEPVEVFDPQEQTHASGELLPNHVNLMFAISAGKEDACLGSGRPDDDPAFRTPVICERRCVLDQLELKHVHEKSNSRIIFPHNDCHQFKIRH